ncbi:hypothetical protein BGY98DRAFT_1178339 [Russula aff. rugulosa BPL654]|nr:hypothetical protein BGY98DRAFT_1178339 [Russula aff. rugulosa BPL654]
MTLSYEKTQTMRRLKDLLPSEQTKQGDRVLKAAAELLERRKRFTDRENYIMARGLLTIASDYRHGIEKKGAIRRSQQSRLYLDKAKETLRTIKHVTEESASNAQEGVYSVTSSLGERERGCATSETVRVTDSGAALHDKALDMAISPFAPVASL